MGDEKRSVTLDSFYIDSYEVTNKQVTDVFNYGIESGKLFIDSTTVKNNHGDSKELLDLDDQHSQIMYNRGILFVKPGKGNKPCVEITWYGAVVFCNLLSEMRGLEKCYNLDTWECDFTYNGHRLPTSAEWEYAAGGGINKDNYEYAGSNDLNMVAWSADNSLGETHNVGELAPNSPGLFDVSGNVWELCWDWQEGFNVTLPDYSVNPIGPDDGYFRVMCGGSFWLHQGEALIQNRSSHTPHYSEKDVGFRIVRNE